jgi:hypothetical protein
MCMCVTKKKEGRKEDWEEREKGKSKEVENLLFFRVCDCPNSCNQMS